MKIPVMVATDGSAASRQSSLYAVRLARILPLELTLVHAVRGKDRLEYRMIPDFQLEMIEQGARRHAQGVLDQEAEFLRQYGVEVGKELLTGPPGSALCAAAEESRAAALIIGRQGHGGLHDLFYGSTCNHVVNHCKRSVVVVHPSSAVVEMVDTAKPSAVRILVALDESDASARCLSYLEGLAPLAAGGVELTLVYVVNRGLPALQHLPDNARYDALTHLRTGGQDLLHVAAEKLQGLGYTVHSRMEEGDVGKTICRLSSEDQQEVVMLGRRALLDSDIHAYGAVCHYVTHHCATHVWIAT